jgi:hypothetical protein
MEKSESKGQFQKIFAKRKNRDLIFFHSEIVEKKKSLIWSCGFFSNHNRHYIRKDKYSWMRKPNKNRCGIVSRIVE